MGLIEKHRERLDRACQAVLERRYWSAYAEIPSGKIYGENAREDGEAAFETLLGSEFPLDQPGRVGAAGEEKSPYGIELGLTYPRCTPGRLIAAAQVAQGQWQRTAPERRAAICLEILERLNEQSFLMANAVMHTTGQAFMMAFQAGGAHAQDRGLEAVAYAYRAMSDIPADVIWEKPQGRNPPLKVAKTFKIVPRGIALVIGCATFPTWNSYPGLFASLVTGNPVIVKPHPEAVLPLALTVKAAREVLAEEGFDPNLVTLQTDSQEEPVAQDLALDPAVRIVDFTGGNLFGDWLEKHARQAKVYTEKAGVNAIVVDDFSDIKGLCRNLAFTLSLYSGQMCTTPQNIFIPKVGIRSGGEVLSFDAVAEAIASGVQKFLSVPERAVEVLGAIQSEATLARIEEAALGAEIVLESQALDHPAYPRATVRTPVIVKVRADRQDLIGRECFGPVAFLVATNDTDHSLSLMEQTIERHGAITAAVYSDHEDTVDKAEMAAVRAGVSLSVNLTGGLFVNQSAAFSDYHATGANPAANASLTDMAFVAGRFHVVQTRRMID